MDREIKRVSYRNQEVVGVGRKRVYVTYEGTSEQLARGEGAMTAFCYVGERRQKVVKYGDKTWLPVGMRKVQRGK